MEAAEKQKDAFELGLQQQLNQAMREEEKNRSSIIYYQQSALANAELLMTQSRKAFTSGEIDYATLVVNLRQALTIQEGYIQAWSQYNQSVITIQYLTGNK
jgi:cobalt-zinc-cadmium resistance protein CzcA